MPDPTAVITAQLRRRLDAPQFSPFIIVTSDGARHEVPSRNHLTITRLLRRVELEHDSGDVEEINPLHITRIVVARQPGRVV
ncbi:MAG: hypothetical protein RLZZ15_3433 [Verrucomicrobiota bacterium]|jgi:hypothetical protein